MSRTGTHTFLCRPTVSSVLALRLPYVGCRGPHLAQFPQSQLTELVCHDLKPPASSQAHCVA